MEREERTAAGVQALAAHEAQRRQLLAVRRHMEDARLLLERVNRRERQKREGMSPLSMRVPLISMGEAEAPRALVGVAGDAHGELHRACGCQLTTVWERLMWL